MVAASDLPASPEPRALPVSLPRERRAQRVSPLPEALLAVLESRLSPPALQELPPELLEASPQACLRRYFPQACLLAESAVSEFRRPWVPARPHRLGLKKLCNNFVTPFERTPVTSNCDSYHSALVPHSNPCAASPIAGPPRSSNQFTCFCLALAPGVLPPDPVCAPRPPCCVHDSGSGPFRRSTRYRCRPRTFLC